MWDKTDTILLPTSIPELGSTARCTSRRKSKDLYFLSCVPSCLAFNYLTSSSLLSINGGGVNENSKKCIIVHTWTRNGAAARSTSHLTLWSMSGSPLWLQPHLPHLQQQPPPFVPAALGWWWLPVTTHLLAFAISWFLHCTVWLPITLSLWK